MNIVMFRSTWVTANREGLSVVCSSAATKYSFASEVSIGNTANRRNLVGFPGVFIVKCDNDTLTSLQNDPDEDVIGVTQEV